MTTYNGKAPPIGTLVFTNDGKELGRIKTIDGVCFKIDAPMAPDYWLGFDSIRDMDQGPVVLTLNQDEMDDAKMETPSHAGFHRHT